MTKAGIERRKRVIAAIRELTDAHGVAPTLREIGERVGLSLNTVHFHVSVLASSGLVARIPNAVRSIALTEKCMNDRSAVVEASPLPVAR